MVEIPNRSMDGSKLYHREGGGGHQQLVNNREIDCIAYRYYSALVEPALKIVGTMFKALLFKLSHTFFFSFPNLKAGMHQMSHYFRVWMAGSAGNVITEKIVQPYICSAFAATGNSVVSWKTLAFPPCIHHSWLREQFIYTEGIKYHIEASQKKHLSPLVSLHLVQEQENLWHSPKRPPQATCSYTEWKP